MQKEKDFLYTDIFFIYVRIYIYNMLIYKATLPVLVFIYNLLS